MSGLFVSGSRCLPYREKLNFLSEGVRCGLDKEIAPDGTYLAYFPFGAMIERSQMTPYHKKEPNLLSEWCSSGADTKKPRMGCT